MTFVKALQVGLKRIGASWATLSSAFIYWKDTSLTVAAMSSNLLASHLPQSTLTLSHTLTSSHAHGEQYYFSHSDQLVLTKGDVDGTALPEPLEKHHKSALRWYAECLILRQSLSAFTKLASMNVLIHLRSLNSIMYTNQCAVFTDDCYLETCRGLAKIVAAVQNDHASNWNLPPVVSTCQPNMVYCMKWQPHALLAMQLRYVT